MSAVVHYVAADGSMVTRFSVTWHDHASADMSAVVHYVAADGPLVTRFAVTWHDHASAIAHAATMRGMPGVSCVWIGPVRHTAMLDAIAERQAERYAEPTL